MRSLLRKILLPVGLTVCAVGLAATATLAAAVQKDDMTISLTIGKADTVNFGKPIADVLIANPAVADIGALRADKLYIVGKALGDTNVLTFDEMGNQLANIPIHVRIDDKTLKSTMEHLFPDEDISVRTVNDDVILTGRVSTPAVANQVRDMASRFVRTAGKTVVDLMTVEGEQQVMLKVKVVEAKRTLLREYGVATDFVGGSPGDNQLSNINSIEGTGLQSLAPFATGTLFIWDKGHFGPLQLTLQGMEKDGLLNVLAEPNLTAISGETAGFLAGGEFPVPTGRDQDGNITLDFKQFGVALNFTPTVMSSDRISLQLSTEVSTKSDDDGVTLVNTRVPGLSVRRAETTVQVGSGGTLMIAGLIKSDTLHNMTGFPGIKDIPILGDLFKSKSFSRGETELVIMVTPYIVQPFAEPAAERVVNNDGLPDLPPLPKKRADKVSAEDAPPSLPALEQTLEEHAKTAATDHNRQPIVWDNKKQAVPPLPERKPKQAALVTSRGKALSLSGGEDKKTLPVPEMKPLPIASVVSEPLEMPIVDKTAGTEMDARTSRFKPGLVGSYNEG